MHLLPICNVGEFMQVRRDVGVMTAIDEGEEVMVDAVEGWYLPVIERPERKRTNRR